MANRYYRRSGEILRDDGQEIWSIYNPKLRGWERTKRANEAYATAFQDPFHRISGEENRRATAAPGQVGRTIQAGAPRRVEQIPPGQPRPHRLAPYRGV